MASAISSASSSLGLSQEELKAVELTRQRLYQLSNSIASLKADVYSSYSLPNLDTLQNQADILQQNMRSLLDIVSENQDLFSRVAVHPSTNFPGRTQENILLQILRKKPEPDVQADLDEGRKTFASLGHRGEAGEPQSNAAGAEDVLAALEAKWVKASNFTNEMILEVFENDDPYTAEEREMGVENVRTGLRRVLEEYEDEDEDGNEEGDGALRGIAGSSVFGPVPGAKDDEDLIILDHAPPSASLPAAGVSINKGPSPRLDEGLPLENMLRLATRGEPLAS